MDKRICKICDSLVESKKGKIMAKSAVYARNVLSLQDNNSLIK